MSKTPQGLVIYDGPSMINGYPIVAVVNCIARASKNAKTGNMLQTWILYKNVSPTTAINLGLDYAICGSCPLRGIVKVVLADNGKRRKMNRMRSCYVTVKNAPTQTWRAYQNGNYPVYNPREHNELIRGRKLRLGAYGDPTALPFHVWRRLTALADGHTGYTHQWDVGRFWRFRELVMASVETEAQALLARSRGWRTFRTSLDVVPLSGEFNCPASNESGNRLTCFDCCACDGAGRNSQRASVMIQAHGSPAVLGSYRTAAGAGLMSV